MPVCDECGVEYDTIKNECSYCSRVFCPDHRLPEKHECPGLDDVVVGSRHFESGFDDAAEKHKRSGPTLRVGEDDEDETGPQPMETVRTHGGSGRDRSKADFSSSPDVNPDGSLDESEAEPEQIRYQNDGGDDSLSLVGLGLRAILGLGLLVAADAIFGVGIITGL